MMGGSHHLHVSLWELRTLSMLEFRLEFRVSQMWTHTVESLLKSLVSPLPRSRIHPKPRDSPSMMLNSRRNSEQSIRCTLGRRPYVQARSRGVSRHTRSKFANLWRKKKPPIVSVFRASFETAPRMPFFFSASCFRSAKALSVHAFIFERELCVFFGAHPLRDLSHQSVTFCEFME